MEWFDTDNPASDVPMEGIHPYNLANTVDSSVSLDTDYRLSSAYQKKLFDNGLSDPYSSPAPDAPTATVALHSMLDDMNQLTPLQNDKGDDFDSDAEGLHPFDPAKPAKIANIVDFLMDRASTPTPFDDSSDIPATLWTHQQKHDDGSALTDSHDTDLQMEGIDDDSSARMLDEWFKNNPSAFADCAPTFKPSSDANVSDLAAPNPIDVPHVVSSAAVTPDFTLQHKIDDTVYEGMEGIETHPSKWAFVDKIIEEVRSSPDDVPSDQLSDMRIATPSSPRIVRVSYITTADDNQELDANGNGTPTMDNDGFNNYLPLNNVSMIEPQLPWGEPPYQTEYIDGYNEVDDTCVDNNEASYNVVELEAMLAMTPPLAPIETCYPSTEEHYFEFSPDEKTETNVEFTPDVSTEAKKPGRPSQPDASEKAKKMRTYREEKKALDDAAPEYIYKALKRGLQLEDQQRIVLCISYTLAIITMTQLYNWEQQTVDSIRYLQSSDSESNTPKMESSDDKSKIKPLGRRRKTDGKNVEKRTYQQKYKRERGIGVWFELLNDVLIELKAKLLEDYCGLMSEMEQKCKFLYDNLAGKCHRRLRSRTGSGQTLGDPPDFAPGLKAAQKPAQKKGGVQSGRVCKPARPRGRTDHPPGIT